jgi:hypothetical protein
MQNEGRLVYGEQFRRCVNRYQRNYRVRKEVARTIAHFLFVGSARVVRRAHQKR